LKNVATGALVLAIELVNSNENTAKRVLENIEQTAINRLEEEQKQSQLAMKNGDALEEQIEIIKTWEDWYLKAASTTSDMVNDEGLIKSSIQATQKAISEKAKSVLDRLGAK